MSKAFYKTLKGGLVRSPGEQEIANFLFEQKIRYKYEKELVLNDGRKLHPDFFLLDYNAYIEYFGMLGDPEYNIKMGLKMNAYNENNINIIEIYPNNLNNLANVIRKRFEKTVQKTFPQRKFFPYKRQLSLSHASS